MTTTLHEKVEAEEKQVVPERFVSMVEPGYNAKVRAMYDNNAFGKLCTINEFAHGDDA